MPPGAVRAASFRLDRSARRWRTASKGNSLGEYEPIRRGLLIPPGSFDFIGCTSCRPFLHPQGAGERTAQDAQLACGNTSPRALRHRPHDLLRAIHSAPRHAAEPAAAPAFSGQSFMILRHQRQAIVEALAFSRESSPRTASNPASRTDRPEHESQNPIGVLAQRWRESCRSRYANNPHSSWSRRQGNRYKYAAGRHG